MADYYTTGQITLTNGSASIVGVGTAWVIANVAGGTIFVEGAGNALPLDDIADDTHATASIDWTGASGTYNYALLRATAFSDQLEANSNIMSRLLIGMEAGTIYRYDVSGDLADKASYDERPKDFAFLAIDVNPAQLFIKASSNSGDWAGPFSYGTGDQGPPGPAAILNWRGAYNGATTYAKNDGVSDSGRSFISLQDGNTGHAVPVYPATANAWWGLTAEKGADGASVPADGSVTNAKLANVATATIKGRSSAGTGVPQDLTAAQARGVIEAYLLGGFRNGIINGNMNVAQAGTSLASGTGTRYCLDQWRVLSVGSTVSTSRQSHVLGQTAVPGNPEFFLRVVVNSVAGAGNFAILQHRIEGVRKYAGKRVTATFYVAADAAKNIAPEIGQEFGSGGSPSASVYTAAGAKAVTTSIQKISFTIDVPSIAGKTLGSNTGSDALDLTLWLDAGSNFASRASGIGQQSMTLDISRVSLVEGDATQEFDPFSERPLPVEELLCKRYFYQGQLPLKGIVNATGTLAARLGGALPTKMRGVPAVSVTGSVYDGSNTSVVSGVQTNYSTAEAFEADCTISTALTTGRMCLLFAPSTVVADARL